MRYLLLTFFSLSVFFLFSTKIYSQEERWIYVGVSLNNNKIKTTEYYDSKTISYQDNSSVIVWVKDIYEPYLYNTFLDKYVDYAMTKLKIFCNTNKYQRLEETMYFSDGTNKYISEPDIIKSFIPESIGEAEFNLICK